MMRRLFTAVVAATAVAGTVLVSAPATQATNGLVINGTPNPPLAGAAVYYETKESSCTGSLLLPNLLVTAAHCMFNDDGSKASPGDIRAWQPGVNAGVDGPSSVNAVSISFNPGYTNAEGQEGIDVAYIVFDGALGTPVITRVATQSEVVAFAARDAVLSMAGYGLTAPRNDPNAKTSDVPIGMSAAIDSDYAGGIKYLSVGTNGVTGTCAGDSGSPWMIQQGSEVLLVGVTSSGDNPPCEPVQDSGNHDYLAVVAGQGDLLANAQQAAGAQPTPTRRTCLKAAGAKASCASGNTWTYDFCWDAPRYRVEQSTGGGWKQISAGKARRYSGCGKKTPYRLVTSGDVDAGTTRFRIVIPKQPGVGRVTYDPFTVTSR